MFDIGFSEILVIFVLALIVLGPEKLPRVVREVGRWVGRARSMARQFQEQLESEVDVDRRTIRPEPVRAVGGVPPEVSSPPEALPSPEASPSQDLVSPAPEFSAPSEVSPAPAFAPAEESPSHRPAAPHVSAGPVPDADPATGGRAPEPLISGTHERGT